MLEDRFRAELRRLPPFRPTEARDQRVWNEGFSAWRAIFTSLCLYEHANYGLPSFEMFFKTCRRAYTVLHKDRERLQCYFEGELLPGMRERAARWYESGLSETYLYVCLAQALEDHMKAGVVLYDARADWKLKADLLVLANGRRILVESFWGDKDARGALVGRRDAVDRVRKQNTSVSTQKGNRELAGLPKFQASMTAADCQRINGVPLFSVATVNDLLNGIYQEAGLGAGYLFAESEEERDRQGRALRGR